MEWLSIVLALVAFGLVLVTRSQVDALVRQVAHLEQELSRLKYAIASITATAPTKERVAPAPAAAQAPVAASEPGDWARCPRCAFPNPAEAPFCGSCGNSLGVELIQAPTPAPAPPPIASPAAAVQQEDQAWPRPPIQTPPPRPILKPLVQRVKGTEEWEALIGARWMNRIGAVALILGLGFFFKYAVDQNWISQSLRIAIGLVVGAGLLIGAWRSHAKDYTIFAQGLVGAGIATLYLCVYASFQFYHLVPEPVALAGMACVTALALVQALYYDSLAVALLAWVGGFVTMPLLGISTGTELGLIGYLLLLNAGMLAIVFSRDAWLILEPLSMGATYVTYFAWYFSSYHASKLVLAAISVTLLWALFYALDASRILTRLATYRDLRNVLGAGNALAYYGAMFALLHDHRTWMGLVSLAIGAVYMATVLVTKRGLHGDDRLDARYTLTVLILAVIATPILVSGFAVVILWSLEALALLWCGVRWNLWYIWRPALGLFGLASAFLLATNGALVYSPLHDFRPVLNERFLAFVILAAALAAGAFVLKGLQNTRRAVLAATLHYAWCAAVFLLLTVETNDYFRQQLLTATGLDASGLRFQRFMILSAIWMLYSLPLVWYGLRRRILPALSVGLSTASLALVVGDGAGATYQPIERFQLLWNVRLPVQLLLIGGLLLHLRLLTSEREAYHWVNGVIGAFQTAVVLAGLALITTETNDFFLHRISAAAGQEATSLGYTRFTILVALWILYSLVLAWYAWRTRLLTVLVPGLGIALLAICAGAAAGAAYQPIERFQPVLNVRTGALVLLIAGLAVQVRWLTSYRRMYDWGETVLLGFQTAVILLGFELVTAETNDYFRHLTGTSAAHQGTSTGLFLEFMALATIWMALSVLLVSYGVRHTSLLILVSGLGVAALGIGTGGIAGILLQPGSELSLALSVRPGVLLLLIAGLFVHLHLLRSGNKAFRQLDRVITGMQAAIVLLGFALVTGETRDFFQNLIQSAGSKPSTSHLRNLEQMTLSAIWLLYAMVLMGIGFWRRTKWLRLGAMALLGFIILKIFVYDLSFLSSAYRSISFAGLGVILIGVSYLYQRYKGLLLDAA